MATKETGETGETGVKMKKLCPFSYAAPDVLYCDDQCKWYLPSNECALIIALERIWFALKDIRKDLDEFLELQAGEE